MNQITTHSKVSLSILNSFTTEDGRPLVVLNSKGEPVTTSKLIADFFGRRHDEVFASIEKWKTLIKIEEHVQFFSHMLIDVPGGQGAVREFGGYELTEEGFALVALSFTGEKAAMFKIAYVKAFRLLKQEVLRLQAQLLATTEAKLLKEQDRNANVKDRIRYLEGKKALIVDDKMNRFAQETALIDREQRHKVEQELFELRCLVDVDEATGKLSYQNPERRSDYKARVKFVKDRCAGALRRLNLIEGLFKGTSMEGEFTICSAISGVRAELEFARYW